MGKLQELGTVPTVTSASGLTQNRSLQTPQYTKQLLQNNVKVKSKKVKLFRSRPWRPIGL
jgi:hypothetical protein